MQDTESEVIASLTQIGLIADDAYAVDNLGYLRELIQSSMDNVEQQRALQHTTQSMLQHQLAEVCMRNTNLFVQAQDAIASIPESTKACERMIDIVSQSRNDAIQEAARKFEQESRATQDRRKSLLRLEESLPTVLENPTSLFERFHTCMAQGNDHEALVLATRCLVSLPDSGTIRELVQSKVHSSLSAMHRRLLRTIQDPRRPISQVRRTAQSLDELSQLVEQKKLDPGMKMSRAEICEVMLSARLPGIKAAFKSNEMAYGLDAWSDTMIPACTYALSLFVEPTLDGRTNANRQQQPNPTSEPDITVAMMAARFGIECISSLSSWMETRLNTLVRSERLSEEIGMQLRALHSQLDTILEKCSKLGLVLRRPYSLLQETALALWNQSLEHSYANTIRQADDLQAALEHEQNGLLLALNGLRVYAPSAVLPEILSALGLHLEALQSTLHWDLEQFALLVEKVATQVVCTIYGRQSPPVGLLLRYKPSLQTLLSTTHIAPNPA
ncbi:hypothetical protein MYAM1_001559 [Malassezia yamatoensis]|uniref:Uncharacterized protein n=1 Tax=Malassezia yamatoensis TaxID=253288 RepID=A0AAJ5YU51_9BASI|nr:hypothetical protein MYAM1_001559 [Malassezia yamatoensis]